MLRPVLVVVLLTLPALPQPAVADEQGYQGEGYQSIPYQMPNPWRVTSNGVAEEEQPGFDAKSSAMATTLSLATPPLLLLGTLAANLVIGSPYWATRTNYYAIPPEVNRNLMVVAPLGFGTGYVYAGEPVRGALVGLGGVAITAAGFGLPMLVGGQGEINLFFTVTGPLMLASLIGYGWWVSQDLSRVVEQ